MADIAQDAGMLPDDALLPAASKLFFYLWNEAWSHAPETIGGDAEGLHDMRVAMRRLRSALQNFEGREVMLPPHLKKEFWEWRKRLARLGDALGRVRDHDVLDDYLKDYAKQKLKASISAAPGLAAFERYLQTERAKCFGPMVKRVNRSLAPGGKREEFARWALGVPAVLPPESPGISLRDAAHAILAARIEEALVEAITLENPADDVGHHELRKSLRRIRYSLETMSVAFAEPVKPHIKKLTDIQDILGEMQDRAVLLQTAQRAFADGWTEDGGAPDEDVNAFLRHGESRRRYGLGRARSAWKKLQAEEFFEQLRAL